MKKIIKLWVYENENGSFLGESDSICINTNIPEIADTPVEFWGNSKDSVIQQVLDYLKSTGEHGILRVVRGQ